MHSGLILGGALGEQQKNNSTKNFLFVYLGTWHAQQLSTIDNIYPHRSTPHWGYCSITSYNGLNK